MASDLIPFVKQKTIQESLNISFDFKTGRFSMTPYSCGALVPDSSKISDRTPLDADVVSTMMIQKNQVSMFKRWVQDVKKMLFVFFVFGIGYSIFCFTVFYEFSYFANYPSMKQQILSSSNQSIISSNSLSIAPSISPSCLGALNPLFCHRIY